jgi:hypothetical protein
MRGRRGDQCGSHRAGACDSFSGDAVRDGQGAGTDAAAPGWVTLLRSGSLMLWRANDRPPLNRSLPRRNTMTLQKLDKTLRTCIEKCMHCHQVCLQEASRHCLEAGGAHVAPHHYRLMMACAEICRSSAAMMSIGVDEHVHVCAACAEICSACAGSCESIGDMDDCVRACRDCAQACNEMAGDLRRAA